MARITTGVRNLARGFGGATLFNGTTGNINCGSEVVGAGGRTISAWIFAKSWGELNFGRLFDNGKVKISVNATDAPKFSINFSANGTTNAYSAGNSIKLNKWIHVVVTWTAAGVGNCYINGELSGTANQNVGTPASGTTNLIIGNRNAGDRAFNGYIAEACIIKRVVSTDEIWEIMNGNFLSDTSNLWELDDTPPTNVDSIGGINGTGTDTALVTTGLPMQARVAATDRVYLGAQYIPTPYMDEDAGSGYPAGWSVYSNGTITRVIDAETFVTGNGALRLTCASAVGTYKINQIYRALSGIMPSGALKIGSTVRVFIRYKISTNTYVFIGIGKSGKYKTLVDTGNSADWTELTKDICFSSDASDLNVDIQVKNKTTTDVATLWVDELRITHVPRTVV